VCTWQGNRLPRSTDIGSESGGPDTAVTFQALPETSDTTSASDIRGAPLRVTANHTECAGNRAGIDFQSERKAMTIAKNTICLWYDKDAEAAARFYAETFPNSSMGAVHRAPSDYPSGKAGDVLMVEFTVADVPCLGLNGGPAFKHSEAFSFQIATDDQQETDRYWNAIVGNGGQESACGWCKDKWGISWQITPRVLTEALAAGGVEAKRAFVAMMDMKKIDVAAIEAARRGVPTINVPAG
jgi:predicted 3-demethylubiquinone-9 3-methyltransferase (glyoxalase superfamily)